MIHAMPADDDNVSDGVRLETLDDVVVGKRISIVRYPELAARPDLAAKIVDCATKLDGAGYDRKKVVSIARLAINRLFSAGKGGRPMVRPGRDLGWNSTTDDLTNAETYICSDFIFEVYSKVLRERSPLNNPNTRLAPVSLPSQYFVNPALVDVPLTPAKC
ncbi:MAG: hypothetical protein KDE31_26680 [Caldilineaceae bacterium]|nr:hypothetical protein [Caldilineaceae bacterium]